MPATTFHWLDNHNQPVDLGRTLYPRHWLGPDFAGEWVVCGWADENYDTTRSRANPVLYIAQDGKVRTIDGTKLGWRVQR